MKVSAGVGRLKFHKSLVNEWPGVYLSHSDNQLFIFEVVIVILILLFLLFLVTLIFQTRKSTHGKMLPDRTFMREKLYMY